MSRYRVLAFHSPADPGHTLPLSDGSPEEIIEGTLEQAVELANRVADEHCSRGDTVWVRIAHDQAFLCAYWRWFACVPPPGWVDPLQDRAVVVYADWLARKAARESERKAADAEHKKTVRNEKRRGGDAIVDQGQR